MKLVQTPLDGVVVIYPDYRTDSRGGFFEAWQNERYGRAGLPSRFDQCNVSRSAKGVLRGLHLQHPDGQAKLVTALSGSVFDVAVDVRPGSPTFRRWFGIELSGGSGSQLFIPVGYAHGFLALSDDAVVMYLTTMLYQPASEIVIRWDDPTLGIAWPAAPRQLSGRDASAPSLDELLDRLPAFA